MTISTYTDLKNEVKDFSHRSDIDAKMDTFCQLAEAVINKDLRTMEMRSEATLTLSSHLAALPSDYLSMIYLQEGGGDDARPLRQMDSGQLDYMYNTSGGKPMAFDIQDYQLEVRPGGSVADPYSLGLHYYARVPSLVSNSTNDVLTVFPLIYLSAMMMQVSLFLQDDSALSKWAEVYQSQVGQANKNNAKAEHYLPSVRLSQWA